MSTPVVPLADNRPKPLSTGKYVLAVVGLCVLMALTGATAKLVEESVGGDQAVYAAWAVGFLIGTAVLWAFARFVGNPTAWIVCGVMFGLGAQHPGEELGKMAGGWWPTIGKYVAFFVAYLLWVTVIHPRVAGRPNPYAGPTGHRVG